MSYTLIALFLLSGESYVERRGLSLQGCAGHAAMARQQLLEADLVLRVGEVQFYCVPERTVATVRQ
jgi:hypothetical protein